MRPIMKNNTKSPQRILVVKPSSLGDVIHALPVVSAINNHWPEAEVRWLVQPAWRSLVEHHPGVSGTVLFPREKFRGVGGWIRSLAWMRTLSDWKPDLAIDLQGLLRSALFARLSGAPRVVGLSDAREGARLFYGEQAAVKRTDHAVNRYLSVLDLLGAPRPASPEFKIPEGELPQGFSPSPSYVVIHPYARGVGKNLAPDLIESFALGAAPHRVVIVGRGNSGVNRAPWPENVEDWSNRTDLLELTAILREASFIISTDSGPMHLATALQPSKTLAIHLWSDPLKVGPCMGESLVWKNGRISEVRDLDDSWRAAGKAPTTMEMRELGRIANRKTMQSEG
jgi:ADP-heptose:LPS heptosyltransferase